MKSIIKELWYGNICPQGSGLFNTAELRELIGYEGKHRKELDEVLTDEQKRLLHMLQVMQ